MNLATAFDKIVVLSIDSRYEQARERLGAALPNCNLHWYVAGDGTRLNPSQYSTIDPTSIPSTWNGSPNSYKAFLCFQNIIHKAYADGLETILILEDDVEFVPDYQDYLTRAKQEMHMFGLPKWDMLYLGANHSWAPTYQMSPTLLRLNGSVCWHAVALRRSVFNDILAWLPTYPIDLTATTLHGKFNCYALWPSVATQTPGYSNVEGRYRDYSEFWSCQGNPAIR